VFLGFLPFLLAVSLVFSGIYLALGEKFIHGGTQQRSLPSYVDPYDLLSEPTVDPTVPLQEYSMYQ
jgi:hypothetical protein